MSTITVEFFNNHSEEYVVNKTLESLGSAVCQFTEGTPIDAPEILLDMQAGIKNFNYCKIADFGRGYFCNPMAVNGNQMRLSCESDALSSFWNAGISTSPCIAERSTSNPNSELADNLVDFKPIPSFEYTKMAYTFTPSSAGSYILTVGGK